MSPSWPAAVSDEHAARTSTISSAEMGARTSAKSSGAKSGQAWACMRAPYQSFQSSGQPPRQRTSAHGRVSGSGSARSWVSCRGGTVSITRAGTPVRTVRLGGRPLSQRNAETERGRDHLSRKGLAPFRFERTPACQGFDGRFQAGVVCVGEATVEERTTGAIPPPEAFAETTVPSAGACTVAIA